MNYWRGEKVRQGELEPSDWEFFFKLNMGSERARYQEFLWPPLSQESVKTWVLEQSRKKLEKDSYFWVITDSKEVAVGSIDTHHCEPRTGTFSYGIDIASEYRRKGYAAEGIQMVIRYYFEELRYQKVTVNVHSNNQASIDLHEKLGFQKEGVLRRMIYTNGQFYDDIRYGMTREEFEITFPKPSP